MYFLTESCSDDRRLRLLRRHNSDNCVDGVLSGFIMPLLYSVVARGTTVLAKYATCTGNFEDVTEHILAKIPPNNDKLTYSQGPYLFHYICEDRIIYMCISDDVRN